ncbi:uncharacterized protein LOC143284267 [Babylonia areolata]|uniref:uncharacterized protein LOC143284267 n=1 Tax=Babylonia areolata TaxID=304850 RepID=UPI003FCFB9D4
MFFGSADKVTETTTTPLPTTANMTDTEAFVAAYQATDAATLPVLIVIVAIIGVVAVAVFAYLKIRSKRRAESERRARIRMSMTNNAGVYMDLSPSEEALQMSKHPPTTDVESQRLNRKELQR